MDRPEVLVSYAWEFMLVLAQAPFAISAQRGYLGKVNLLGEIPIVTADTPLRHKFFDESLEINDANEAGLKP